MGRIARYTLLSVSLLNLFAAENTPPQSRPEQQAVVQGPNPRHVLTNEGIVKLCEAGYDEPFLIDLIQAKQTRFDTTVDGLTFLADHGISRRIIRLMLANENKSAGPPLALEPVTMPVKTTATARPVRKKARPVELPVVAEGVPAPATGPYVVAKRHLFWHRRYVVNPAPAAAVSSKAPEPAVVAAEPTLSSFPAF